MAVSFRYNGSEPFLTKQEMCREAIRKLGVNVSTDDVKDYCKERWSANVYNSTISTARAEVRKALGIELRNGTYTPPEEKSEPPGEKLTKVIELVKEALKVAGTKEYLRKVLDLL